MSLANDVKQLEAQITAKGVTIVMTAARDLIWLSHISLPKNQRSKGLGSWAMSKICELADKHGARITLTAADPSQGLGTKSKEKLLEWYSRFGFFEHNTHMIRIPV